MTTIVCISDLHEHLVDVPACDLLLIAGDVSFAFKGDLRAKHAFSRATSRTGSSRRRPRRSCSWPATTTSRSRPGACPAACGATTSRTRASSCSALKLWGTPWQPWFYDWAFNAPRRDGEMFLASKFDRIPAGTDIVVAHRPSHGYATERPAPAATRTSARPR